MSDFLSQYIPIWSTVKPNVQQAILKQGTLAHQPIKVLHKGGCLAGGGDCLHCKIIPCGGSIPCFQCTVKHCGYAPPCNDKGGE